VSKPGRTRDATATGRAGQAGVLVAMCTCLVLVVASVSALNLALPDLALDLSASTRSLTWIADGYTVALAALVLPIGALGDRIGRRNVLVVGTAVFAAGSLAASFAHTTSDLIAWRIVMGGGAAMIMPGTLSTITSTFPPARRARGVAVWSGFAAAGAIIGLLSAGLLLEVWSWRSIFLTGAVVAVAGGALALLLTPDTREGGSGHGYDVSGALTSATAIGTLVFGIIEGNDRGWTSPTVIASFGVSAASLGLYALLGMRRHHPLLDPRLFGIHGFRAGAITVLVQFLAVFGFFFVGLQYLQLILGYTALKSAAALMPVDIVVLPTTSATPWLARRIGVKAVMGGGLLLLAGGLYGLSFLTVGSGYLPFLAGLIVAGLGIGLTSSMGTAVIVGSLGRDQQGVASAVNDSTREVGSAIGIALMGTVFGSHYRAGLPTLSHLPAATAHAVQQSPAAGLEAAAHAGPAGPALAAGVESAFLSGLSAALITVSIILAVAAIGAFFRAPRVTPEAA
jgi:EmrB/QacA subfamily drug resistance transporter